MREYRFSTLFVLACTSLLLMVAGCDQSAMKDKTDTEEAPAEVTPTKQEKELNAALDAMAQDVAAALRNQSVRTLIKKETGKLLAGQHNVLFQTIATKKVQGMAKVGEPMTFQQVLAQQRASLAKNEGLSKSKAVAQLEEDAATIPKFDIGVPVHHKKWDPTKTTPLVAFHHRQEIDDTELERVKAYDAEGNVHWLDAQEAPGQPVVVVGVNERTTADGSVLPAYRHSAKDIEPCERCDGGGGGDGGDDGSSEDDREYGDKEYLERVKVTNDREPWWLGDPELWMHVESQDGSELKHYDLYKREGSTANPFNSDDESWNRYDTFFFKWEKWVGKEYTIWTVWEKDSGENSVSLTVTYQGREYGVSADWTNESDKIGMQAVQFDVDDDQVFDLGGFKFETESKNP